MAKIIGSIHCSTPQTDVVLVASKNQDLSNPITGLAVATQPTTTTVGKNLLHIAKPSVSGLPADGSEYFYGFRIGGVLQPAPRGRCRVPLTGAATYSFALASCTNDNGTQGSLTNMSNHAVFRAISDLAVSKPLQFFFQTGDFNYPNITTNTVAKFDDNYALIHRQSNIARLFATTRVMYSWSDHDGAYSIGGIGAGKYDPTALPACIEAYNRRVPIDLAAPLNATTGPAPYFAWQEGRVWHVSTNLRAARTVESAPDNSSKSIMGATQKAWFKAQVDYAAANNLALFWYGDIPMQIASFDLWPAYSTERNELFDYMASKGMNGRVAYLCGDTHLLGITLLDYSTGNNMKVWEFCAAPLSANPSPGGYTWTDGEYTGFRGQFGVVTVTDSGGSTIDVTFEGMRVASETDPTTSVVVTKNWTTSSLTGGVAPPSFSAAPTWTGTPKDGQALTITTGTISNTPTSISFQKQRSIGGTATDTGSPTSSMSSITPTLADAGFRVRWKVTATNAGGSNSAFTDWTPFVAAAASSVIAWDALKDTAGVALNSHVTNTGSAWATQTGYTPTAGGAKFDNTGDRIWTTDNQCAHAIQATPINANYYAEAELEKLSLVAGDLAGIAIRMGTASNDMWYFRWSEVTPGWQLVGLVAGSGTGRVFNSAGTFNVGEKKVLRVSANGNTINCYVDDMTTPIISVTDASISATGRAGIRMTTTQTATTGIHMNWIYAVNP